MYNPKSLGSMNPRPVKSLTGNPQARPVQGIGATVYPGVQPRNPARVMPGTPPESHVRPQAPIPSRNSGSLPSGSGQFGGTIEGFGDMMRRLVSNFAMIDENVYQQNMRMAHGEGMSEQDRALSLECATYLMTNMAFICMGLVLDQKFKKSFLDAVSVEMYIDGASDAEKKQIRDSVTNPNVYKSPYSGMIIGMTTFMPQISRELMHQLNAGFDNLSSYAGEFDAEVAKLTQDQKMEYGFIFSNFMYLIRAFMQNDAFMGYVATVLDKVRAIISNQ